MQKQKNLDNYLFIRISSKEKEELNEMVKYYGIQSVGLLVRELIRININKYKETEKGEK